jgi:Protein of unknown function (DUF3147)
MEWVVRFLAGGTIISLFATIGDIVRPKGFAGLFAAAPSVALATLALTIAIEGRQFAATEARSMIVGAIAFVIYAIVCVYLMGVKHMRVTPTATGGLAIWGLVTWSLWALFLR